MSYINKFHKFSLIFGEIPFKEQLLKFSTAELHAQCIAPGRCDWHLVSSSMWIRILTESQQVVCGGVRDIYIIEYLCSDA